MRILPFFTFSFLLFHSTFAQSDRGLLTYKLGTDTTTIQYFEYNNHKFKTTIVTLSGLITRYEGTGELDSKGDINRVESKTFRLDSTGNWFLMNDAFHIYTADSSIYTAYNNGQVVARRAIPAKGIVSTSADPTSFFTFPYMSFYAPSKIGDTLSHCQLSFGECRKYDVSRQKKNELNIGSTVMGRIKLFVDDNNRLTSADGIGSSLNFIATVERDTKNYAAYLDQFAKRRFTTQNVAHRNVRDTARLIKNDIKIEIDHWKPHRRGREIFGSVVPWNRFWRLGANNSTQLRTTHALNFNGKTLPAGKYSLWAFPTESSWTLMINSKADVWGTEYDPSADVMKEKFTVEKANTPVDIFRITLQDLGNKKVRMVMEWEYYKAFVDFGVQ